MMASAITTPVTFVPIVSRSSRDRAKSQRRTAIKHYQILDSAPEAEFDNIAMLAARICNAQSAAISFIDVHRQWFKATCGLDQRETPIAASFCAHAIERPDIMVVTDARLDPRFVANPLVTGAPYIRFYAGARILAKDGTPIASLCVFDPKPRPHGLTQVEQTTLLVLAGQVQSLLELRVSIVERQAQLARQSVLSKELQRVAEHDALTGLPHRGLFNKRLIAAMHDADRNGTRMALMLVDVDHFKQINDSLGHDVGDALLCSFADRLRSVVRRTDTAARLGGDEFGVVLAGIRQDSDLAGIIKSLNERLHLPMEHRGRQVDCQASIGVAIYPDHAKTPETLTKCSDLALAEAKIIRGCVETFRPSMVEEFQRETQMLSIARAGVEGRRIIPHYQPKVDLASGALIGFEALVRCEMDGGAPILPEMFAPAFADRKLAAAIGEQMLARVLDDVRAWVDRGLDFGHVAINSCAADFSADDFAERLLGGLNMRNLPPSLIELEVTEGVFLGRGAHHVKRALTMLSEQGVRIALDDFGTGYASLIHLKQFPVDVLKIDRSFVAGIGKNPDDTAIVRALIGLGNNLGIATVAEGIETQAQETFVRAHGCDIGQGFLYSTAQPADQVADLIASLHRKSLALQKASAA
jgi:diguanylate cyclase (GGDEF)-like protein